MTLQEAYSAYTTSSSKEDYELFGEALLRYVKAIAAQQYGSKFRFLEEAVGESIIKVLSDLPTFDSDKSPLPVWIKHIVCNVCTDILRNHNNSKTQAYIGNESHRPFDKIGHLALRHLFQFLDADERTLVEEKLYGLTEEELAEKYSVNQSTISRRLARIEKKLRTHGVIG